MFGSNDCFPAENGCSFFMRRRDRMQKPKHHNRFALFGLVMITVGMALSVFSQGRPDSAALIATQRDAMKQFALMDGVWRGPAWTILPSGEKHNVTQTERIGPFLDGSIKVIEGRGYGDDGKVTFNALGIVSFDPEKKTYTLHSHAMGRGGEFELKLTTDGYEGAIP